MDTFTDTADRIMARLDRWLDPIYAEKLIDRVARTVYILCSRNAEMDWPTACRLLWSKYPTWKPRGDGGQPVEWDVAWEQTYGELGLPIDWASSLQDCAFLVRVTWERRARPLLLVGEIYPTITSCHLNRIVEYRNALAVLQHEVMALLIGATFADELAEDGPVRVAAAGAVWLERPYTEKHPDWFRELDELLLHAYRCLGAKAE